MLSLFKKKPIHNFTVQDIHNEFDSVEDELLRQAESLLKELNIPTETAIEQKAKKLIDIGFKKSSTVKQAEKLANNRKEIEMVMVKTKHQAELIRYYKQNYPFQKFLTEDELDRICRKYNLIYAPIDNYIEDVPDKNINEIQNAPQLKVYDAHSDKYICEITDFWMDCPTEIRKILKDPFDYSNYASNGTTEPSETYLKKILQDLGYSGNYNGYIFRTATVKRVSKAGLFICAPASHFDLKELKKDGQLGYFNIQEWEIKDPIVFRYVRGGVQVITKWGLEAQDEMLINETMN